MAQWPGGGDGRGEGPGEHTLGATKRRRPADIVMERPQNRKRSNQWQERRWEMTEKESDDGVVQVCR